MYVWIKDLPILELFRGLLTLVVIGLLAFYAVIQRKFCNYLKEHNPELYPTLIQKNEFRRKFSFCGLDQYKYLYYLLYGNQKEDKQSRYYRRLLRLVLTLAVALFLVLIV
jgi:hypothetical protein